MLLEFLKYVGNILEPKAGSRDITIVRRYKTPTGFTGEIYVDGKQHGVSCDSFLDGVELFRLPLNVGFESGKRVLRTDSYCLSNGDFTAKIPYNYCYVGSLEIDNNVRSLSDLLDKCMGFKYIRLTVLNRVWSEF